MTSRNLERALEALHPSKYDHNHLNLILSPLQGRPSRFQVATMLRVTTHLESAAHTDQFIVKNNIHEAFF